MLREKRIACLEYEPSRDQLAISVAGAGIVTDTAPTDVLHDVGSSGDHPTAKLEVGTVSLLLDKEGNLVGVDLGGPEVHRVALMAGPHEAVSRKIEFLAKIVRDTKNEVAQVWIVGAKRQGFTRAGQKSPYLN
jgi:hypothetical protein